MFNWLTPGVGAALGGGLAGLFGYKGAKDQNIASAQQAQNQMDFQREMSNTAVQRRMADLQKAGINPILAGSKEASTPAGAMAPQFNKAQAALSNLGSAATIANTIAQTKLTDKKSGALGPADLLGQMLTNLMEAFGFKSDSARNLGSALDAEYEKKTDKPQSYISLGNMDYHIDSSGKSWTDKELETYLKKKFPNSGF